MPFDDFWRDVKDELQEEQTIRNWTMDNGYFGRGDFGAIAKGIYIKCYPPEAEKPQKVPGSDFQFMYENTEKNRREKKVLRGCLESLFTI
ncbi:unnamed protein product [marine sediment metagenome]|uniref:Uncharacterized protein n=1 Tax=marine sediment metagenome TaxID=412755 RepID=X1H196_9ZZZZ